jgi:hypothetical protein
MIRLLIISDLILLMVLISSIACGQVIDLDEEQESLTQDKFEKSTMYYISPGDFGYQLGLRNMYNLIESSLEIEPNDFTRFVGFGMGLKRKAMYYNFYAAFQPFTSPIVKTSGTLRTVADFSTVFAEITAGRAIISTDRHNVVLKGGLGLFGNEIQIRRFTTDSFDLNRIGIGQGTAWPLLEHYSGTYDIALELIPRPVRTLAVMASFQLGYKGSIGSPNWMSPDAFLFNSISDRISMVYLRMSLVISRQY